MYRNTGGIINHKSTEKKKNVISSPTAICLSHKIFKANFSAPKNSKPWIPKSQAEVIWENSTCFHNHQVFTRGETAYLFKTREKKQFWVHLDLFWMVNGEFTWAFHMTNPTFGDKKAHGGLNHLGLEDFMCFSIWPIFFLGKKLMSNFQKCL